MTASVRADAPRGASARPHTRARGQHPVGEDVLYGQGGDRVGGELVGGQRLPETVAGIDQGAVCAL